MRIRFGAQPVFYHKKGLPQIPFSAAAVPVAQTVLRYSQSSFTQRKISPQ